MILPNRALLGVFGAGEGTPLREGTPLKVEMVDPQRQLLREIADERLTRDDVALTYAFAIRQASEVDFLVVNLAIAERWSVSGLQYIKRQAWKTVRTRRGVRA